MTTKVVPGSPISMEATAYGPIRHRRHGRGTIRWDSRWDFNFSGYSSRHWSSWFVGMLCAVAEMASFPWLRHSTRFEGPFDFSPEERLRLVCL